MLRRTPLKYKPKKKAASEKRHHALVATKNCVACGSYPVEVHHVRHDGFKGISKNHKLVVPLCHSCHRTGANAVHAISHQAFNELWGIDLYSIAKQLWDEKE